MEKIEAPLTKSQKRFVLIVYCGITASLCCDLWAIVCYAIGHPILGQLYITSSIFPLALPLGYVFSIARRLNKVNSKWRQVKVAVSE